MDPGPEVPDYSSKQVSFLPPVLFDHVPSPYSFGSVVKDAKPQYSVVSVIVTMGEGGGGLVRVSAFIREVGGV